MNLIKKASKGFILFLLFLILGVVMTSCSSGLYRPDYVPHVWKPDYRNMPGKPVDIWYTNTNITVIGNQTNTNVVVERSLSKIDPKTGKYVVFDIRDVKNGGNWLNISLEAKLVHWKADTDWNGDANFLNNKKKADGSYISYKIDVLQVDIDTNRIDYVNLLNFLKGYGTKIANDKFDDGLSEEDLYKWLQKRKGITGFLVTNIIKDMKNFNMLSTIFFFEDENYRIGHFTIYVPDDMDVDDFKAVLERFPGILKVDYIVPAHADF